MQIEDIITDNQNLVYAMAHQFKNYNQKEDLYQVGDIGLIKAYQNYDETKGAKFTTYAFPYVLGEMKKLVREDKSYKVSRDIAKLNLKIEKAYILLSQKLMREPSTLELANYLELDEYLVVQALKSNYAVSSIDENLESEGKDINLHEILPDTKNLDMDTLVALKTSLESLNDYERTLIESRYMQDLTQSETAGILGINQVQVSRMEQKVLKKMRQYLS